MSSLTLTTHRTRCRGTLQECLQQAVSIYHQTHEGQGNPVWRVLIPDLAIGSFEKNSFALQELLDSVKTRPEAAKQAILEYDTDYKGENRQVNLMSEQKDAHLWVFAKLYLEGKKEPVALIYHIDFEDEEEDDSPVEDVPLSIQDRVPKA